MLKVLILLTQKGWIRQMSKYTTEVRFICETESGLEESKGFNNVEEIIEAARPKIFSFDFPIFDEEYRSVIETKILRHYYTREIGMETYGLWKLRLMTKLNEIMPFYNKLYESELLKYNPLHDVDMTTTNVGRRTGERTDVNTTESNAERTGSNSESTVASSESNGSRNTISRDLYSDTPQGSLTGVEQENYLTNARKVTGNDTTAENGSSSGITSGESTSNEKQSSNATNIGTTRNTEDYILHIVGKSAGTNYSKMIKEFRDNFLNIDMDIIRDLGDLFMLIW